MKLQMSQHAVSSRFVCTREADYRESQADSYFFKQFAKVLSQNGEKCQLDLKKEDSAAPLEHLFAIRHSPKRLDKSEMESLYVEVLYTVKHKIGLTAGGHSPYSQSLNYYSQLAFGLSPEEHAVCFAKASQEKPPIVILNVTLVEGRDLDAKDADGFSDPYCMLGIMPASRLESYNSVAQASLSFIDADEDAGGSNNSGSSFTRVGSGPRKAHGHFEAQSSSTSNTESAGYFDSSNPLRKFGQSIRRRVGGSEKSKQSGNAGNSNANNGSGSSGCGNNRDELPVRFIRVSQVIPNTLNPKWNEQFRFDLEDVNNDLLHLDIWDHDDETDVFDAVSRLNQVRGVRGLGRYFKQVGQSARRSGGQDVDDFLGCVTIKLDDIPSTGVDRWYKLVGRSSRSRVQGQVRLKMSLATREDRGISEEDNCTDVRQQEDLLCIFIDHELRNCQTDSWLWTGQLPEDAETILHQHAIQGDITRAQLSMCRWLAYSRKHREVCLDYDLLSRLLIQLEQQWEPGRLNRDELQRLGESFQAFIAYACHLISKVREYAPYGNEASLNRLRQMLRCLVLLHTLEVFRYSSPFSKDLSHEISTSLKVSNKDYYTKMFARQNIQLKNEENVISSILHCVRTMNKDLYITTEVYAPIIEAETKVACFATLYKFYETMLSSEVFEAGLLSKLTIKSDATPSDFECQEYTDLHRELFQLYLALCEFVHIGEKLVTGERRSSRLRDCFDWFRPVIESWLSSAKFNLIRRIEFAVKNEQLTNVDSKYWCSISAVDVTNCMNQIVELWRKLEWPNIAGRLPFVTSITQIICDCVLIYTKVVHEKLRLNGYYDEKGQFDISEQLCLALNNMQRVGHFLSSLPESLHYESLAAEIARQSCHEGGDLVLQTLRHIHEEGYRSLTLLIQNVLDRLVTKMRQEIRKNMFHLCWAPDSVPVEKAICDLLTYLNENIATVRLYLVKENFNKMMCSLWRELLDQLIDQMTSAEHEQDENKTSPSPLDLIYIRLHSSLGLLCDFFNKNDHTLAQHVHCAQQFERVKYILELNCACTEKVAEMYFIEKLEEQKRRVASSCFRFGELEVRAHFIADHGGVLTVEVVAARNLLPLDPNGLSDPFVIVQLYPTHVFPAVKPVQTRVVKNSLNPVFKETFEFNISKEKCKVRSAVICFTVMDKDLLVTDDFEGEVYLSLSEISGVEGDAKGYEALKIISLPLVQAGRKEHLALSVLTRRTNDSYAQDVVRRRRFIEKQAIVD